MATWTYLRRGPLFWPAVVLCLVGVGVSTIAHATEGDARALLEQGTPGEATVVDLTSKRSSRSRQHYVKFTFSDASGKSIRTNTRVSSAVWHKLQKGATVPVRYSPDQPAQAKLVLDLEDEIESRRTAAWIGAGMAMLAGAWCLRSLLVARRRAAVIQLGERTTGFVRLIEDQKPFRNRPGARVLVVAYADGMRQSHEVRSPVLPPALRERWPQDAPITVCFDRREPTRAEVDIFGLRGQR